jgi:hypothetical protein
VLEKIRTEKKLGPHVQLNIINIQGLKQDVPEEALVGEDLMWDRFPQGGKVRVQANKVDNMRSISECRAERCPSLNAARVSNSIAAFVQTKMRRRPEPNLSMVLL